MLPDPRLLAVSVQSLQSSSLPGDVLEKSFRIRERQEVDIVTHQCLFRVVAASLFVLFFAVVGRADQNRHVVVENGVARAAIVRGGSNPIMAQAAAEDLKWYLERASGATIQVVPEDDAAELTDVSVRFVVGDGTLSRGLGVSADDLKPEEYRIRSVGRDIVIVGHDLGEKLQRRPIHPAASPATLFAVSHLLDRYLGVRWLWPGELGTFVPERRTIVLPQLDITAQPGLEARGFMIALPRHRGVAGTSNETHDRMVAEAMLWSDRHQLGTRSSLRFGHAFTEWWDAHHDNHPDYFAVSPPGEAQRGPRGVKLCTSNPAVIDQVVADWRAAGRPSSWNVCPNDGIGFCTCQRCRAQDAGGPLPVEHIWAPAGRADLSNRHVLFQNAVLKRMKSERPDVRLCAFAYGAYRNPPRDLPVESGMVLEFVHGYQARNEWQGWSDLGVKLALRPNWLHSGANAPYLTLHQIGDFLTFARQHGMVQNRFDSLHGYWSTQGPNYYLIARLSSRPDLTVENVIAEYVSAFGPAAPAIRRWINYWQSYSDRLAITLAAGGEVSVSPDGLYERTCRQHDLPTHPLLGSWRVLPHLYHDGVLSDAGEILDDAAALAVNDVEATARVQFLKDGLDFLRATRDLMEIINEQSEPDTNGNAELQQQLDALRSMSLELSPRHVVWGDVVLGAISRRILRGNAANAAADVRGE